MTSLTMLQHVCRAANIEVPSTLTLASLTYEQDQLLRMLSECHSYICGMKDWWFLQRVASFRTVAYRSGIEIDVTKPATPYLLDSDTETPFGSATDYGLYQNAKMHIGTGSHQYDVVRVNASAANTATVLSAWVRSTSTDNAWVTGQDEYALGSDVERVSWVLVWKASSGTSITHTMLEAVSWEEMDKVRRNRTSYIYSEIPERYCIKKHLSASSAHTRYIVLDPFPKVSSHVLYGYMTKPTELYDSSAQTLNIPPKHQRVLFDKVMFEYYSTVGMGAPAGSPAGEDVAARAVESEKDFQDGINRMLRDQSLAMERASLDPNTMSRQFHHEAFGRSLG